MLNLIDKTIIVLCVFVATLVLFKVCVVTQEYEQQHERIALEAYFKSK